MSTFAYSHSYTEDTPTLEGVEYEISDIVGLSEIKSHLQEIVSKIVEAEKCELFGLRVVPPKPFHMVFLGNFGTGKSTVARIIGKLFYLGGCLPSHRVIEMQSSRQSIDQIEDAKGGILLVDVAEHKFNPEVLEAILSAMDGGKTAVIFAGQRKIINQCINLNRELYKRFCITIHFNDLTCQELAQMVVTKMNNNEAEEDSDTRGLRLHPACSVDVIEKFIALGTSEKLREQINGYVVDPILRNAKTSLETRTHFEDGMGEIERRTITKQDLNAGICFTGAVMERQLCM